MIVGMNEAAAAARTTEALGREVGEHLVDVHVRLRARTGLPDRQRELVGEPSAQHLLRRERYRAGLVGIEQTQIAVDLRRSSLHMRESSDQLGRHALGGNLEVLDRALGLGTPEASVVHRDVTHRISFNAR